MDSSLDPPLAQEGLERVPASRPDYEQMIDVLTVVILTREYAAALGQLAAIPLRFAPARVVPFLEVLQLHAQHRSLNRVQTAVLSLVLVVVLFLPAVVRQHLHSLGKIAVVRYHAPGIAIPSHILPLINA